TATAFVRLYMYTILHFFFFFFSSRRRHTRCYRDWSSDVCSSDLQSRQLTNRDPASKLWRFCALCWSPQGDLPANDFEAAVFRRRSEERRVGKECRSRWSTAR